MNYLKIQKRILDNFLKEGTRFGSLMLDEHYLIFDNIFQLFRIPESEMWLNVEKMMEGREEETSLKKIIEVQGEDGVLTGDMKCIEKKTAVKVASENNSTWIDRKLLDRYEIKSGLHFTISDKKTNPVLVWENEVLCGLICPVRVEGD